MRRNLLGVIVVACGVLAASNLMAVDPGTGIIGSVHDLGVRYPANPPDFLDNGPADNQARVCIYCHAPHNTYKLSPANQGPGAAGAGPQAPDPFTYLPLWNHALTDNYGAYSMYFPGPGRPLTGPRATQSLGASVPGATSLLCLSCHDGSVAVNSYGNIDQLLRSRSIGNKFITMNTGLIGKNNYLGNHHPIGFNYAAVSAVDTEIRDAGVAILGTAGTVAEHLYDSRMECGTCHSVHNKGNTGESLLWRSDSGSRLCLTCHDKGTLTDPTAP
jgi:predicted CXXCH cytochrome family protein